MSFSGGLKKPSVPVGGIVPFHKDFDTSVSLPPEFKECDGTTISDADSPLDGLTVPNLQGNNRFMRADSSTGSTGGNQTTQVDITVSEADDAGGEGTLSTMEFNGDSADRLRIDDDPTPSETTSSFTNEPQFFDVVMAMRIK